MSIGSYSSTVDLKNNPAFENIESDLESVLTENNSIDRSRFDSLNCPVCQRLDGDPTECFHVNTHQMTTKYPVSSKSKEELIQSLHTYLHAVSLESVVLKSEVEVLRKAFDSKCRAVDILRSENSATVNTRSPDSTTSEDALTVHEELNRVRLELEKVKGTLIANHHAWNTKVQQLSRRNDQLAHELEESERKAKLVTDENIYLMCKHRNSSQLSSAEITRTNKQQHPLPSLSCNGNTVFDFTDPNVSISAEAFLSALDSRSAGSSPHPCRSTPTTPTLSRSQMGSSVLSFTDTSDRGAASRLTTPTVNSFSLVPPGIMRSTIPESHPDVELPMARPINSPSNRFDTKNAPEAVTCTCMPNGPVLCECAVQAVRIQRHLLRCRRQLFKETNRIQDLKVTIEAYRIALENQFKRNRSLSTELAALLNLVPYKACSGTLFEEATTMSELQKTTQHENTDVICAELNPSTVFRNLLLWFHQNLDNVAVAVNRLNTPNFCTCGVSRQNYNRADKTFDRGSLDSLYGASGDAEYRKIGRSTSRHLPTGSGRRIARLRDSRSLTDLRLDVDEATIVKESPSTSPSGFPHSSSPERIRKRIQNLKVSHTLGAAAKVRSRARSVELIPVLNSDGRDHSSGRQPSEETRSSLSVMSELVVKISELTEILAKQELIADITATAVSR